MYELLIKLRLLAETILTIVSLYAAIEIDYHYKLINLILFGFGIFAFFCTANTIDKIQKWGNNKNNQEE